MDSVEKHSLKVVRLSSLTFWSGVSGSHSESPEGVAGGGVAGGGESIAFLMHSAAHSFADLT